MAMSRILFLQDSGLNESLAVTDLSSWLQENGHQTHLLLENEERNLTGEMLSYDPKLVVIPCPVGGEHVAKRLASIVKKSMPSVSVMMGGTSATFEPELAMDPNIDAVCAGEAEGVTLELVERLAANESFSDLANLSTCEEGKIVSNPPRALIQNLDDLPMPDRDLYFRHPFIARFPWKKFATGRGCVHSCSFCWNPNLKEMYDSADRELNRGRSSFVRRKSPERSVEEVAWVKERYPLSAVHFSDDLFTIGTRWLEEFANLYASRVGVPFTCNSSIELVTKSTIDALVAAGCRGVAIGIETGNEDLRSKILNKRVSNDQVRQAARIIKSAGLELTTFNMLGSPGETISDAFDTVRLNREIGTDHMRVALAVPMPHSEWEQQAWNSGHLSENYSSGLAEGLSKPKTTFKGSETKAFENFYYLFRLMVRHPKFEPGLRAMLRLNSSRPLQPFRLLNALEEKRIFNLDWGEGLRFFSHVGDPKSRTANYVTLI